MIHIYNGQLEVLYRYFNNERKPIKDVIDNYKIRIKSKDYSILIGLKRKDWKKYVYGEYEDSSHDSFLLLRIPKSGLNSNKETIVMPKVFEKEVEEVLKKEFIKLKDSLDNRQTNNLKRKEKETKKLFNLK